jgi:hypothetical protein
MVQVIIDEGRIDLDGNGVSQTIPDDEALKPKKTKKELKLEKARSKLKPLDLERVNKLKNEEEKEIIRFGKFKGMGYADLLHEDMDKYVKFLKRCPFKNENINDFLGWYENNKKL